MIEDKGIGYILHKAAMMNKNNFTNKLTAFGLTPGQFTVLKEIYYHKAHITDMGLSPAGIAEGLECDRPTISGIIDRLEEQKWIVRVQNSEDKRSCIIHVTDKTRDKLKELEEIHKENQNIMLKGFTEEETILFAGYLLRVTENFKGMESL
ncbi:MAG: MarR family winged helix-turn-helix transcriptional regulator [Mobilitalea sp.]